jgi:hypothetical protein
MFRRHEGGDENYFILIAGGLRPRSPKQKISSLICIALPEEMKYSSKKRIPLEIPQTVKKLPSAEMEQNSCTRMHIRVFFKE